MRDAPERRCVGMVDLFLSTMPTDHETAARFCKECPALSLCRKETDEWLAGVHGLGTEGTFAGTLYRKGRPVDMGGNRCEHCGQRAKRKQSRYCSRFCTTEGRAAKAAA